MIKAAPIQLCYVQSLVKMLFTVAQVWVERIGWAVLFLSSCASQEEADAFTTIPTMQSVGSRWTSIIPAIVPNHSPRVGRFKFQQNKTATKVIH